MSDTEEKSVYEKTLIRVHVGMTLEAVEKQVILRTLRAVNGNKQKAARILGISRRSIYNKLKLYDAQDMASGDAHMAASD